MKVLIYQLFKLLPDSEQYIDYDKSIWKLSRDSIKKYAEILDYDYKFFTDSSIHPRYSPFHPFIESIHLNYDKIVFIDSDVLATKNANNIINESSDLLISIKQTASGPLFVRPFATEPEDWVLKNWQELNSGVVVFPKAQYKNIELILNKIIDYEKEQSWAHGGWDQEILFDLAKQHGFYDLHFKYNYMMTYYKHRYRFEQTFIHYHYNKKSQLIKDFNSPEILK